MFVNVAGARSTCHSLRPQTTVCVCIFYFGCYPVFYCYVSPLTALQLFSPTHDCLFRYHWIHDEQKYLYRSITMILLAVTGCNWVWISVISTSKSWQLEILTMHVIDVSSFISTQHPKQCFFKKAQKGFVKWAKNSKYCYFLRMDWFHNNLAAERKSDWVYL